MTDITQNISEFGDLPDIADPSTFEVRMNALITAMLPLLRTEINTWGDQVNTMASELAALAEISALLVGPGGSVANTLAALGAGAVGHSIFNAATVADVKSAAPIVSVVPVNLSGTAVDFTSIPSWAKRITVQYSGLSTNGTALPIVQLGDSGGPETSGYVGSVFSHSSGDFPVGFSSGFAISGVNAASSVYEGTVTLTLHNAATNTWTASIVNGNSTGVGASFGGGSKALTATLDRIRLTTVGGTNVFDGGTASLLIE